jgi:hypothetical protein
MAKAKPATVINLIILLLPFFAACDSSFCETSIVDSYGVQHGSPNRCRVGNAAQGCFTCGVRAATANSAQRAACLRHLLAWHWWLPSGTGGSTTGLSATYTYFRPAGDYSIVRPFLVVWRVTKLGVYGHVASQRKYPGRRVDLHQLMAKPIDRRIKQSEETDQDGSCAIRSGCPDGRPGAREAQASIWLRKKRDVESHWSRHLP